MTTTYIPTETDNLGTKFEQLRQERDAAVKKLAAISEWRAYWFDQHHASTSHIAALDTILNDGKAGQ